ncbi:PHD finger protein 20b isoform X2 [Engraulis encrasicolus]|uniref:PHD finger protein 20b isoform X2 n=1 Tax=Engraulis encrasicolus TaxID=184585 RepID=UPI002FD707CD
MAKEPPHRRGITFEVGAQLEARDSLKNWYPANIEKIDYEDEKVLIHYKQWSHRYDEWFDWSSPYLRSMERIQLRRQGLQDRGSRPGFQVNQKVLASWSDCRYYPAKVVTVNKDGTYTVKFFDGVVKTVSSMKVKSSQKEGNSGRSRGPPQNVRRREANGKDWKPKRNGSSNGRANGSRHSLSDQDGESEMEEEEEEREEEERGREEQQQQQQQQQEEDEKVELMEPEEQDGEKPLNGESKKETEKMSRGGGGEGGGGEDMVLNDKAEGEQGPDEKLVAVVNGNGAHASSPLEKSRPQRGGGERNGHSKAVVNGSNPALARRTRRSLTEGNGAENKASDLESKASDLEHRRRRVSRGQTPPPKRSRAASSTDRSSRGQRQSRSDSVPASSDGSSKEPKGPSGQSEGLKQDAVGGASADLASLVRQQVHLPATNKYSREPLYRVIKNQPPPILSIELDHNHFKCKVAGCQKSFRKASLLHYHMKYYHSECELSPPRSIQTRASEKQAATMDTPRRRRTVSLHSHLGDNKSGHSLSPPLANGERRQRSNSEKSKENQQMNRKTTDEPDSHTLEIGGIENERLREKRYKDFLRIKLKKKKKKKRRLRSKSDYSSSEENIGLNAPHCALPLNLAHKFPLSHKHNNSEHHTQLMLDGEDSGSDWSTDSPTWSEDELEAELDLSTPLEEQGVAIEPHGVEIVRCVCEVQEENDFMIQCEECFCWQHGTCMGLMEDSIPETYSCYICRDPPAQRQSKSYWYEREWLSSGQMYGLSFLEENYSQQNGKKIVATHQLLGDVQRIFQVLNGLQLKMSILQSQQHPDLKLWRQPWRHADPSKWRSEPPSAAPSRPPSPPPAPPSSTEPYGGRQGGSFQDSYISSEHCYQKPRTYYPAVEQRLVVETRGGSELEDSLRSTEDLLEALGGRDWAKTQPDVTHVKKEAEEDCHVKDQKRSKWLQNGGGVEKSREPEVKVEVEEDEELEVKDQADPDVVLQQQWQLNLLDHIEAVQDEVTHRMDFIERELDVLESWLDYTGELEPPDPLARLPQLKHRIKELLTDLDTVQQIAVCSSST